ncbi:hypothetical protein [Pseudomonas sp. S1Bt23]|uniref:hypothetical protein n=1 Tax=Pseudomonas sp. S1Bt23 TaxID=3095074 RepID=UPI002A5A9CDC|nr:hypothetical protein [Pseudomonas sp. S1Bt23]WPO49837.1 hypothetical protein SHB59_12575 [Pseudomonas sp. S1Bt23]
MDLIFPDMHEVSTLSVYHPGFNLETPLTGQKHRSPNRPCSTIEKACQAGLKPWPADFEMPPKAEKAAVSPGNRASDSATPSGIRLQGLQYDERSSLPSYFN